MASLTRFSWLDDSVSFVHVMIEHEDVDQPDSLGAVPAFQAFVADIDDRCDVAPVVGSNHRRRLPLSVPCGGDGGMA